MRKYTIKNELHPKSLLSKKKLIFTLFYKPRLPINIKNVKILCHSNLVSGPQTGETYAERWENWVYNIIALANLMWNTKNSLQSFDK